jgi:hypothetical protein
MITTDCNWPCVACGATDMADAYVRCLDDTGHADCAYSKSETPCPMDFLFEQLESAS